MSKTPVPTDSLPDVASTPDTLLDTAEHLFATQGIENVSMRRIAAESGHGNRSGALYHFGSREALIRRLIERRMEVVDKIRHVKLNDVLNAGQEDNVTAIIAAAINVLVEVVSVHPWGPDYVLVISQAMFNPKIHFFSALDENAVSGTLRTAAMLRRLVPHVTPEKFNKRMRIVFHESVYAFARWLQENGSLTKANQKSFQVMVETVTEFMAAGMSAPLLAPTKTRSTAAYAKKVVARTEARAVAQQPHQENL